MSECQKKTTKYSHGSGNASDPRNFCRFCRRDLSLESREWCRHCVPEQARSNLFKVRLPVQTLNVIKAKHGNVSAYVRGLIAKDLGPDVFPEQALKRPGGGVLKVKTDL
jgi:hypothetical protein